jgi:hypothetical protein
VLEQRRFKPKVVGSIPTAPTNSKRRERQVSRPVVHHRELKDPSFRKVAKGWGTRLGQSMHRVRERWVMRRTAVVNQIHRLAVKITKRMHNKVLVLSVHSNRK